MTPEEEKKISEATERIRQRQETEQRGTTAKDFREMAERNKDKQPYQHVDPIGVNPAIGTPVFTMGAHPIQFGAGTAVPFGAARGSAVPFGTGSAVRVSDIHGFGSMDHTGSLFGGSFAPLGGALGAKTFGMNDGRLEVFGGKLNFTQQIAKHNSSKKKGKK